MKRRINGLRHQRDYSKLKEVCYAVASLALVGAWFAWVILNVGGF